jgi:hypothetical protein
MTREQIEYMKRYTEQHLTDPQMGDHFTDHLSSVAFVESRHGPCVMVAKPDHAKRVFKEPEPMTLEAFREWLSPKGRTWVELWPPAAPKELMEGG